MTRYEELASSQDALDVTIHDISFHSNKIKGLYCDGFVAINSHIDTDIEKACILAEELGHHHTSYGDILDQSSSWNRKQEHLARLWAYNRLIGLYGIIDGYSAGCRNRFEMAEYLGVTESFLQEALDYYSGKYGEYTVVDNYVIYFQPALSVLEIR